MVDVGSRYRYRGLVHMAGTRDVPAVGIDRRLMNWPIVVTLGITVPMLLNAPMLGMLSSPWAPYWFSHEAISGGGTIAAGGEQPAVTEIGDLPLGPVLGPHPLVSDRDRYQLALAAGFSAEEAITATAISIAEDGGGDPAAEHVNKDGSIDKGLWQVNSRWFSQFGGREALADPLNNARAAHAIYGIQGWCAWSTYDARCGLGHGGQYGSYLSRARAAALP